MGKKIAENKYDVLEAQNHWIPCTNVKILPKTGKNSFYDCLKIVEKRKKTLQITQRIQKNSKSALLYYIEPKV